MLVCSLDPIRPFDKLSPEVIEEIMWHGEETYFQSLTTSGYTRKGEIFKWISVSRRLRSIGLGSSRLWSVLNLDCDVACSLNKSNDPWTRGVKQDLRDILERARKKPLTVELTLRDRTWMSAAVLPNDLLTVLNQAPKSWKSLTVNVYAEPASAADALECVKTKISGLRELLLWMMDWDEGLEDFVAGLSPLDELESLNLYTGTFRVLGFDSFDIEQGRVDWSDASTVWPFNRLHSSDERAIFRPLIPVLPSWPSPFHQLTRLEITASDGGLLCVLGCLSWLQRLHVALVPATDCRGMFSYTVERRLSTVDNHPEFTLQYLDTFLLKMVEARPAIANVLCSLACPRLRTFAISLPKWKGYVGHLSKFYTLVALGSFLDVSGSNLDAYAIFPPPEHMLMPPHVTSPTLPTALVTPTSRREVRAWLQQKMPKCKRCCWGEMRPLPNPFRDMWDPYTWPEAWKELLVDWLPSWHLVDDADN
ncbi:hypothetical protein PM082_023243 [Marasmius tenuissimus]|nr:hypothetical protein PM082_023243 [Marasmius tenuissimus]